MINALYGALGAILVLLLFAAGVYTGCRLYAKARDTEEARRPKAEPPEETERRQLIADQRAFRQLMSYNADVAYDTDFKSDQFTAEGGEG